MKKILIGACLTLCLLGLLTACGQKKADGTGTAAGEQTIQGVVNQIGNHLILLDDEEQYRFFDFGEAVDPAALEEGDRVTVTYTGDLDSDDPVPVATAIETME